MEFEPRMDNIPLSNLREEFHYTHEMLLSSEFEAALKGVARPIKTPIFDWHGGGTDLLSTLVRRAIQGVESYTVGASWIKLQTMNRMTADLNAQVRNPFSIQRGAGAAAAFYHHLPSLIHPDLSIQHVDPEFWEELRHFYRAVRNPLFHGSHFATEDVSNASESFRIIGEVYLWLDQWHKPEWWPGKRTFVVFRRDA
jgi:hypothetical protein